MALKVADRVQETTNAAGTGTIQLQGAVTGYRTFATAFTTGDVVPYVITNAAETVWETGTGTLTTGTPWTLARTTITASTSGGSAINVTLGCKVFVDLNKAWTSSFHGLTDTEYNWLYGQMPTNTRAITSPFTATTDTGATAGIPDYMCLLTAAGLSTDGAIIDLSDHLGLLDKTLRILLVSDYLTLKFDNLVHVGTIPFTTLADEAAIVADIDNLSGYIRKQYRALDTGIYYLSLRAGNTNNDYFEITASAGGWVVYSQNFLDWMDGKLGWDKIDKTGAITQTTVDFSTTPVTDKEFTITDSAVTASSKITATMAYVDTTNNTADEIAASQVFCLAGKPAAGSFTLFVGSGNGDLLTGEFKINYIVG